MLSSSKERRRGRGRSGGRHGRLLRKRKVESRVDNSLRSRIPLGDGSTLRFDKRITIVPTPVSCREKRGTHRACMLMQRLNLRGDVDEEIMHISHNGREGLQKRHLLRAITIILLVDRSQKQPLELLDPLPVLSHLIFKPGDGLLQEGRRSPGEAAVEIVKLSLRSDEPRSQA